MTELKGALIGCGFFAVNQMHGWKDVDGAAIVAICDRDPERLKIVGDQFGIDRRYTDAEAMFADGGFDFVDIATTVHSHRDTGGNGGRHKVPAICQKPFAKTLADAKAMVEACRQCRHSADGAREFPLADADPGGPQGAWTAARSARPSGAASPSARATTSFPASPISPKASASSSRTSASIRSISPATSSAT